MIQFDERGSAAIEAAIAGPAMVLLILLVVFGGRVALAHQAVQATAADTARAASLARTQPEARSAATAAMDAGLNQQLTCTDSALALDLSGFGTPVGTPASVTATLTCRVPLADLGLPGPGSVVISESMSSPIDTFRERR
ncbi:MAG: pilus assembly protein [Propionicimonas sp.]|uniref:TadE family protein n=1 Tax=Propionicimonas sp. TaxID=1955623 RepID=UPI003D0B7F12